MNVFDLEAKLRLNTSEYEAALKKAAAQAQTMQSSMTEVSNTSNAMQNAVTTAAEGVSAVGTGAEAAAEAVDSLADAENRITGTANDTVTAVVELSNVEGKAAQEAEKLGSSTSEAGEKLKNAENAVNGLTDTLKKGFSVGVKAALSGWAAISAATAAGVKQSVASFAQYEQLVGGVDTIFKESSQAVQEAADKAFKTVGMSANQYMETVTSFSMSLLQGLGNDTEKAAEYAELAISDMSDNANKMGTAMGSIQYAYQGFAKQNYTMLDNLKLGKHYCRAA